MRSKIFLSIVLIVVLFLPVVAFAAHKAEIYQDPLTRQYFLVDPQTREKLTSGYDWITINLKSQIIGGYSGLLEGENLDSYTGEPVHRFYHEEYKKDDLRIGELGACKYVLDPVTGKRMSSCHHKIYKRDDILFGELGSLVYILDPETKRHASKGYHRIYFENGKLKGELGGTKEFIYLRE